MSNLNALQKQFVSQLSHSYEVDKMQRPPIMQKRLGFNSITDQMRLISYYVCDCGTRMHEVDHSTIISNDDVHSEDIYTLLCSNCNKGEKINFRMLTKYLKAEKNATYNPRSFGYY